MNPITALLRRPLLIVLLIAAGASLIGLGAAPLLDWDENMQSEVARQALVRGEVLRLTLNGQPFTEKPPLFFLEMAGLYRVLGVSEAAARCTSALNGLAFLALLWAIARRVADRDLATLWALLYASSFLPLVFSRSAVMEHTFNALMGLAALLLAAYDGAWIKAQAGRVPRSHPWKLLLAASVALGLAVLTKGPVGGALPLVAFAAFKLARRDPVQRRVPLSHFIACGTVSLAVAASWYAANGLLYGGEFVRGFAHFMGLLFSQPLEGHSGPWFYHFAVGLLGFFPWTPLLLLYLLRPVRAAVWATESERPLAALGLGWTAFVLVVFSIVTTKLPHYSSSMYLPLTLLAALALRAQWRRGEGVPGWLAAAMAAYGVLLGAIVAAWPYLADRIAAQAGVVLEHAPVPSPFDWLPGAALAFGIPAAAWLLWRGRPAAGGTGGLPAQLDFTSPALGGVAIAAVTMGLFAIGLWRVHLPAIAAYNQGPVIELMRRAYAQGGDLALYRNVSYAVLFYGQRDVNMIGTYKFQGDSAQLDQPGPRPLFVITEKSSAARLLQEHPLLEPAGGAGQLALFVLKAR